MCLKTVQLMKSGFSVINILYYSDNVVRSASLPFSSITAFAPGYILLPFITNYLASSKLYLLTLIGNVTFIA